MILGKKLYVTDRKQWRKWLSKNHNKEKQIWLVYYRKSSGKLRITYNDAVEEALCYGWIDSTVKNVDEESFAQRFTPRRPKSNLSIMNEERVRKLIKEKKMTSEGLKAISHAFDADRIKKLKIASDILKKLKENKEAWKNFQKFSESYKRIRIGYIESQRERPGLFRRSLNNFIKMTSKNKKFGMVQ
jgi:uncharacterized protein YdeI (YjbR/CyaY-like superfamily)